MIFCLSSKPVAVDEIVRQCQLTAPIVLTILRKLELLGRLERYWDNRVAAYRGLLAAYHKPTT